MLMMMMMMLFSDDEEEEEERINCHYYLPGVDVANSSIIQLLTKWSSVMIQVSN
jgi:Na+-transporting NADH:ubiquinone oxidoreductase subunit NqrF